MRGKLRDKRATKRDVLKREVIERRRPTRRDPRTTAWLNQQADDDESYIDDDEEMEVEEPTQKK